jgi:molybdate transport system substrate-binding protein
VVSGDAEIAVQQIPEIMAVAGVDYAGPLPAEIQNITVGTAGVFSAANEPQLAQALLDFLQSPEAARVYKARGLEPAGSV